MYPQVVSQVHVISIRLINVKVYSVSVYIKFYSIPVRRINLSFECVAMRFPKICDQYISGPLPREYFLLKIAAI